MSEKLKPCPFCGSRNVSVQVACPDFTKEWVECADCEARSAVVDGDLYSCEIAWNRRAHDEGEDVALADMLTEIVVVRDRDALGTWLSRATLEAWEMAVRAALSRQGAEGREDGVLSRQVAFGLPILLACDGKCEKAWGNNGRPKRQLSDDSDDYEFVADSELGDAPADPGTYEGGDAKPIDRTHNKWCFRECERSVSMRLLSVPVPNKWKHDRLAALRAEPQKARVSAPPASQQQEPVAWLAVDENGTVIEVGNTLGFCNFWREQKPLGGVSLIPLVPLASPATEPSDG